MAGQDGFETELKNFERLFAARCERAGVAGGSFAFVRAGKPVFRADFGLADIGEKRPVDSETIFHWASNTKPLTAIAILQLRDRGRLKLDDPAVDYLPELKKVHNPFGPIGRVTIRHLLNHSSGFRNPTFPYKNGRPWQPFEPTEYAQIEAMLPFTELLFEPGSRFGYSNLAYVFLGRIIEKLSGDDYEVYVDKNILKPLGMHRSYFDTTPYHLVRHRSHSYYVENGIRTPGRFDADSGVTVSNSGLNSPVSDMLKYLAFLIGDDSRRDEYGQVLRRESVEEMFAQTIAAPLDANGNAGFTTGVGLGYFIDERDGGKFLGHGGDQNGFISFLEFNPKNRTGSIVVFNSDVTPPAGTAKEDGHVFVLRRAIRQLHLKAVN